MVVLRSALHLLRLIEDRKYEDAITIANDVSRLKSSDLEGFASDLIYKTAYSFGNENNTHLKVLLGLLFDLLTSVKEKYQLCYELLTLRTSAELTEVLVNQMQFLIGTDFEIQYPELWHQICNELPMKLERRLCQRLNSKNEDIGFAIVEASLVLAFFDSIHFRIPYKFGQLVERVLSELTSAETAAYPFLMWHAREHPFSPRLLGPTEPTVLIPSVYDQQYLRLRLVEGICEYIASSGPPSDGAVISLANALHFLLKLGNDCQDFHACDIKLYTDMFVVLLQFMDNIGIKEVHRLVVLKISRDIVSNFSIWLRALLLKNILDGIVSEASFCLKHQSKMLAWVLDQFEHHLNEKVFVDELGSLFGLLEGVICDDIVSSASFYLSLLRIIRSYTNICVNTSMLAEIRKRLVVLIYENLLQCTQLNVNKYSTTTDTDQNVFANPVCPSSENEEEHLRRLMSLLKDCEETMVDIDKVLQNVKSGVANVS